MLIRCIVALGFSAMVICAAAPARAESSEDSAFARQVFGKAPGGSPTAACFTRVYDDAHLASHPKQNVRVMRMLLSTSLDEDKNRSYAVRIGVQFRNRATKFETAGNCGTLHRDGEPASGAGVAHCGVDCDGGSIDVAFRDAGSMRVAIPDGARLWQAGTENESPKRNFGTDDKLFRLDRADIAQCLPLTHGASDRKELGIGR